MTYLCKGHVKVFDDDCFAYGRLSCQMQRLINQRAKLSVKFTAKLFWVISIMEGDVMHTQKNGMICN